MNISDEIESHLNSEHMETFPLKEIINVGTVTSQEIECHRVIVFHRLTHINNPDLLLIVEHVVFRKVTMHEAALMIHATHNK